MIHSDEFQRRKLLRLLDAEDLSRRELARALSNTDGLGGWMVQEARRAGLETSRVDEALARLGTGWARRAVKRFFLSASPG